MEITLFYDGSYYTFKWLKAMQWCYKEFEKQGIRVKFHSIKEYLPKGNRINYLLEAIAQKRRFDVVFLAFHANRSLGMCDLKEKIEILSRLREKANTLVWLDTADSTGTTQFEVLPYVDLYYKKQLMNKAKEYSKTNWGGRCYCQYFREKYSVIDKSMDDINCIPLKAMYQHKIRLSWNVGLGDLFAGKYSCYTFGQHYKKPDFVLPDEGRLYDIQYRGTVAKSAVGIQRNMCLDLLKRLRSRYTICDLEGKVPHKEYINEVKRSKCILSPFGYGEICTRDFEAFVYGACLIKPAVSHMLTFPNWYIENETYIPVKWDLNNFEMQLEDILHSGIYIDIAKQGQELFHNWLGLQGKKRFVEHIIDSLDTEKQLYAFEGEAAYGDAQA